MTKRLRRPVFDFHDYSVLVTGATSGIGRATCLRFAQSGASLVFTGRDQRRGELLSSELAAYADRCYYLAADLGDAAQCEGLVTQAHGTLTGLDIVVNCAGVIHRATVEQTTDQQWLETFTINTLAPFLICRVAIPLLRQQGGGTIINVASIAALSGSRNMAAYCASKGALVQMTRAMALDHGPQGIRAIAICPGDVDTSMLRGEFEQLGIEEHAGLHESAGRLPLGRICDADEIADLILYTASDAARSITGYPLVVDGGNRA